MYSIIFCFLLFLIYSCIGWIMEVIFVTIQDRNLMNRGTLIGPYCPLYGISALIMIALLEMFKDDIMLLFTLSAVLCTTIEYLTGCVLEKLFHARWWDYSNNFFNLNGRICLLNSVLFGILGVVLIRIVNPIMVDLLSNMNVGIILLVGTILMALFLLDGLVSFYTISKIKLEKKCPEDNTPEMASRVRSMIAERSVVFEKAIQFFPILNQWNTKFSNPKKSKKQVL